MLPRIKAVRYILHSFLPTTEIITSDKFYYYLFLIKMNTIKNLLNTILSFKKASKYSINPILNF